MFTEYWVTCTEYLNPNVLSWDLLHYVVHIIYCRWLMLYHKYSVDIIMAFTCIISVLMITHHHHLVVMCYVWFSFSVSFLFLLCCQYCAWTELQLVLPVSCLETAFFFFFLWKQSISMSFILFWCVRFLHCSGTENKHVGVVHMFVCVWRGSQSSAFSMPVWQHCFEGTLKCDKIIKY